MIMGPRLRRFALVVHLALSVGWIGAVAAYLVLDLATVFSDDLVVLRAAYVGMDLLVRYCITPLAFASVVTGLVMSLGTRWGLFRHYWVVISLILTTFAVIILLVEARTIAAYAELAADPATSADVLRALGSTLLHSVGGLLVLLVVLVLNVYKPRGLTRYGWRRQAEERARPPT